ncbi:MAG: hypothetical protein GY868_07975, partial [Deltaproteobacteria bacterium]|nr:hypothetical protein [Deltaproteobacteria bacterium]
MKKHLIKLYAYYAAVPILTIILFSGCDLPAPDSISGGYSYSITAPTDEGLTLAALSEPDSCEDLILPYKEQAIREMEEQIDANLAKYLNWGGCYHRESTCGDGLDNDNDG